jgi:hypothetical protein
VTLHPLGGAEHKIAPFLIHADSDYTICVLFVQLAEIWIYMGGPNRPKPGVNAMVNFCLIKNQTCGCLHQPALKRKGKRANTPASEKIPSLPNVSDLLLPHHLPCFLL